ncbi:MAG: F0F1 ATP synthase subunit B [Oscillospiraceae bacterium]
MQNVLDFVSFVPWTFVVMILNLFVLCLLLKKFLFKPVTAIFEKRQSEIAFLYANAEEAQKQANADKDEYQKKIQNASFEAEEFISKSHLAAHKKEQQIIGDAQQKATSILEKAEKDNLQMQKKAMKDLQADISSMAIGIAEKVTEKEINRVDHEKLIEDFIQQIREDAS